MFNPIHLKFPTPFSFLGGLLIFVAIFYIIDLFRDGYFSLIVSMFIQQLRIYKWFLGFMLIIVLVEIRFVDLAVSNFCKTYFKQNLYSLLDFCNSMGEGWFLGGVLFTGILISDYFKKDKLSIVFRVSLASLICSGILNTILKCLFNRQRPDIAMNPWHFFHFFQTGAHDFGQLFYASNSMPSGHTIAVFAAITPLFIYTNKISLRFLLVSFALLICIARIYTLNHWLSDVTVGIVLGIIVGVSAYKANHCRIVVK